MIKTTTLNISNQHIIKWKNMNEKEKERYIKSSTHYTLYSYLQLNSLLDNTSATDIEGIERLLYKRAREKKIEISEVKSTKWENPRYGYPYKFIEDIKNEFKGVK